MHHNHMTPFRVPFAFCTHMAIAYEIADEGFGVLEHVCKNVDLYANSAVCHFCNLIATFVQ